jgi:PPK2 family polyphosphate:nucleotide phosphotransferase
MTESKRWFAGADVRLESIDTSSTAGAPGGKSETRAAAADLRDRLTNYQERLWAEDRRALLLVLQAMDAGGKDGAIKKVFSGVNPQGCRVTSFRQPTEQELDHDFLWRIHKAVPARGEIGIFNRSHYEDVVVARVKGIVTEPVWRRRYEIIREFENGLLAEGTQIVKAFLHISKDEQARRLQKRIENPAKRWKFRLSDLDDRKLWDEFEIAYQDAVRATSTEKAPWYVIPADKKWYRDWALLNILVDTLEDLHPQFPEPEEGVEGLVIT